MTTRMVLCMLLIGIPALSFAADLDSRLSALEKTLKEQQKTIEEQQRTIDELRKDLSALPRPVSASGQENAGEVTQGAGSGDSRISGLFGGSAMTNPYISFALNTFFYSSSIGAKELLHRGIPGYSSAGFDRKKGFAISEGELFLFAPVDPYVNLYANIPFTEDGGSLEEVYFVTSSLPEGLQLKGGKFKSGFSRLNAQHPHAWDFADPPLAYRAFFGGEGVIEKGVQLTYLPVLPFYALFGLEVLQGDNGVVFDQTASDGPRAIAGYAKASFDFGDSTILVGPYALSGRTRTDSVGQDTLFRGISTVVGFEGAYKWKPSRDRSLVVQGEYLRRDQSGSLDDLSAETVNRLRRSQDGLYLQSLYQVGRWRTGVRYDRLSLFTDNYRLSRADQHFGAPWRLTGALEFNPSEFSRLRLQYNYDRSGGDGRINHEVFLQIILGIGAHGAHAF
jgi:hypothetical protein